MQERGIEFLVSILNYFPLALSENKNSGPISFPIAASPLHFCLNFYSKDVTKTFLIFFTPRISQISQCRA